MIHVNARAIIVQVDSSEMQIVIQKRCRKGEPEYYELPGGRIEEYEAITDAIKREVFEETGLTVTEIENQDAQILTNNNKASFSIQCIKPFATYQTTRGPVDSFGVYLVCKAEGSLLSKGDDSVDAHFATISEIQRHIDSNEFSDIDKPAMMLFMRDRIKLDMG